MRDYHSKFEEEKYYHIYNRGNNGENIFVNDDNYKYFLRKWRQQIAPFTQTLAYCLMPNHFHFLVRVNPQAPGNGTEVDINLVLENQFKKLFSSYALSYNKQQNRHGSLFEKRFKRLQIDSDDYFSKIIHYIHNNPIHHNFVSDYDVWKYSSFKAIISDRPSLLAKDEVLEWFGGKEEYNQFHKIQLDYGEIKDLIVD